MIASSPPFTISYMPTPEIFVGALRRKNPFFKPILRICYIRRPADHDENYPLLERGHTWPGHPVGKNPGNVETWPRFAKTWSPEWEKGGGLEMCHRRRVPSGKVILSPRLFAAPRTYGLSDTYLTDTQNPRRCPSMKNRDLGGQNRGFFPS